MLPTFVQIFTVIILSPKIIGLIPNFQRSFILSIRKKPWEGIFDFFSLKLNFSFIYLGSLIFGKILWYFMVWVVCGAYRICMITHEIFGVKKILKEKKQNKKRTILMSHKNTQESIFELQRPQKPGKLYISVNFPSCCQLFELR